MDIVETDVKHIISEICGLPKPNDSDEKLSDLGFNDDMCSDLAAELDNYVKNNNPAARVDDDEIASGLSIKLIIELIKKKIAA